ncbi:hypothetical protein LIER_09049 [Lithospermum erythrorhizon]|uniref:LOB domain-containing protein n=1 Tax=Lithospermum erythrorhizon TaxID=34254 RepID=A0AAV3PIL7_LITER
MTGFGTSCGACRFLRRRCTNECVFAPYFSYEDATTHFAAVHKVFGASNVSKLLSHLPVVARGESAMTITYEAIARMEDPVYGCVAHILALEHQVASLKEEIEIIESQMATPSIDSQLSYGKVHQDSNVEMQFPSDLNCYIDQPNEVIFSEKMTENGEYYFGQTNDQSNPLKGWTIEGQDIHNSGWNISNILFDEINYNDQEMSNIFGYQL